VEPPVSWPEQRVDIDLAGRRNLDFDLVQVDLEFFCTSVGIACKPLAPSPSVPKVW